MISPISNNSTTASSESKEPVASTKDLSNAAILEAVARDLRTPLKISTTIHDLRSKDTTAKKIADQLPAFLKKMASQNIGKRNNPPVGGFPLISTPTQK